MTINVNVNIQLKNNKKFELKIFPPSFHCPKTEEGFESLLRWQGRPGQASLVFIVFVVRSRSRTILVESVYIRAEQDGGTQWRRERRTLHFFVITGAGRDNNTGN